MDVSEAIWPMTGEQTLTNSDLATAVQLTAPSGAQRAKISVEGGQGVRFWESGSTPDSTHGHLISPYAYVDLGPELSSIKLIRVASDSNQQVQVSYFSSYTPKQRGA